MSVSWEQFVERLRDSGVVTEIELDRTLGNRPPVADTTDAIQQFTELLLSKHLLTPYQLDQLKTGQHATLVLGPYVILEPLGDGGMGQVFKARHRPMNRVVALKLIKPQLNASLEAIERFRREVRAAAKLTHPNIVMAFDAGEVKGIPFLAMQLIDGIDLRTLVHQKGPLSIHDAVNNTLQIARGLDHAHTHGIIHRDIKPANAIRDDSGTIKILDLGLAQLHVDVDASTMANLTEENTALGTVDYMAPEQAMSAQTVTELADQYSLGCTLHYLLTGRPVYGTGTTAARLLAHQSQAIPSLQDRRSDVPAVVDQVFQRMSAKRPQDRYPSMKYVIELLEPWSEASASKTTEIRTVLAQRVDVDRVERNSPHETQTRTETKTTRASASTSLEGATKRTLLNPTASKMPIVLRWLVPLAVIMMAVCVWQFWPPSRPDGSPKSPDSPAVAGLRQPSISPSNQLTDEEAAEWVLLTGGEVSVSCEQGMIWAKARNELPKVPYHIVTMKLDPPGEPLNFDEAISHFTGLKHLKEFGTLETLTDKGLEHLGQISSLEEVRLLDCQITDSGLLPIAALPNLKLVFIKSREATDEGLRAFSKATQLKSLHFYANRATGIGCQSLTGLTVLDELILEDVPLTDAGLAAVGSLPQLKELIVVSNSPQVSNFGPLSQLKNLNKLVFSCTRFTDRDVNVLTPLPQLQELSLAGTQVTGQTLGPLKSVQILKLPETQLDDAGMSVVATLPDIRVLELEKTAVTGKTLGPLTKLETLGLQRTNVDDDGLAVIAKLPQLKELSLTQTSITDSGLRALGQATNLQRLDLREIRSITSGGIESLRKALPGCAIER